MSLFLSCMIMIKEILTYLSKRIPWRLANKNTATNLSVSCANCGISLRNCSISSFSSSNIWSGSNPSCHYTSSLTSISQQCNEYLIFLIQVVFCFLCLVLLAHIPNLMIHWNNTKWIMWFYQTLWYLENSNTLLYRTPILPCYVVGLYVYDQQTIALTVSCMNTISCCMWVGLFRNTWLMADA